MGKVHHILLVEDNPADVRLVRTALGNATPRGFLFELVEVTSLREAKRRLAERFDVVLLDLNLPDSQGIETFLELHALFPRVPVIVLSGATDEAALSAVREGAQDYLFKDDILHRPLDQAIRHAIERAGLIQNLDNQQNRLRTVVEGTSDGLVIVGLQGHILFLNRAAEGILHSAGHSKESPFPFPLVTEKPQEIAFVNDGVAHAYELRTDMTRWDDERAVYCVTFHDISDQKRMQERLREAQERAESASRLKSEFIANMSHEIRTPLNGVIGMTSLLLETELSNEQRDYVNTLRSSGEHLLGIINDILDLSKIEAGKLKLETTDFNLRDLVEETMDMFAGQVKGKGILFTNVVYPGVPPTVHGDGSRLRQILANLVSNAIKFTDRGRITVAASVTAESRDNVTIRFEVADTGIGIGVEEKKELFKPFTQVARDRRARPGGTGLGLSISKRLVEMMGGEIGLVSETGSGSTFWFTVPFGRWTSAKHPRADLEGRRILLVCEDDLATDTIGHQLALRGMECVTASTPARVREALDVPGSAAPALVILAGNVAELWREAEVAPAVPVLHLQTSPDHATPEGVAEILRGPVRQSQLYATIAKLVDPRDGAEVAPRAATSPGRDEGAEPAGERAARARRVLVVDDNTVNLKVAARMLKKLGFRTDTAANGREAVEAVERVPYAAVFMDCEMPEMDGYEAARRIRVLPSPPPLIALTAYVSPADRRRCLHAGMCDYLAKPIKVEELVRAIRRWVGELPPRAKARPAKKHPAARSLDAAVLRELKKLDGGGKGNGSGFLAHLIDLYLAEAPAALADLKRAAKAGEAKATKKMAHRLKGLSANLGAVRLAELCASIEDGLAGRKLAERVHDVARELDAVKRELVRDWRGAA